MARPGGVLEVAVLGLLHEGPMHGYELRKRLNAMLGWGRAFSYGSLYPCLKALLGRGRIADAGQERGGASLGRRGRIVYRITEAGQERFHALLQDADPAATEDEAFGVRFAFFARTDTTVRLRLLEGRRRRLEERQERVRTQLERTRQRLDAYAVELQQHGLDSVEREVRWISDVIERERSNQPSTATDESSSDPADPDAMSGTGTYGKGTTGSPTDSPREQGNPTEQGRIPPWEQISRRRRREFG